VIKIKRKRKYAVFGIIDIFDILAISILLLLLGGYSITYGKDGKWVEYFNTISKQGSIFIVLAVTVKYIFERAFAK